MKKPSKKEVVRGIQFFIMLYTMTMGFWYTYIFIWFKCGLSIEWWTLLIIMVLALLSMGGLCTWIWKGGADNG
jgi:hypothetical protein